MLPSWAKMLIGASIVGLLAYTTPIIDLLLSFLYFCVIPIVFCACIALALVGAGEWGWNTFSGGWNAFTDSVRKAAQQAAQNAAKP
jgi:hypothetical protein